MKTKDLILILLLSFSATVSAQLYQDETIDRIICPDELRYEKERYLNYEERKTKSITLIKQTPYILQGTVLKQTPQVIHDTLYMEIMLKLEHTFRGENIEDSIVSIYRKIRQSEAYQIVNGKIEQVHSISHPYNWDIRNQYRYLFFCNTFHSKSTKSSFKLYTNARTSYLKEWPSKGWGGLFCMSYLNYQKLLKHLKTFDHIDFPSDAGF